MTPPRLQPFYLLSPVQQRFPAASSWDPALHGPFPYRAMLRGPSPPAHQEPADSNRYPLYDRPDSVLVLDTSGTIVERRPVPTGWLYPYPTALRRSERFVHFEYHGSYRRGAPVGYSLWDAETSEPDTIGYLPSVLWSPCRDVAFVAGRYQGTTGTHPATLRDRFGQATRLQLVEYEEAFLGDTLGVLGCVPDSMHGIPPKHRTLRYDLYSLDGVLLRSVDLAVWGYPVAPVFRRDGALGVVVREERHSEKQFVVTVDTQGHVRTLTFPDSRDMIVLRDWNHGRVVITAYPTSHPEKWTEADDLRRAAEVRILDEETLRPVGAFRVPVDALGRTSRFSDHIRQVTRNLIAVVLHPVPLEGFTAADREWMIALIDIHGKPKATLAGLPGTGAPELPLRHLRSFELETIHDRWLVASSPLVGFAAYDLNDIE